MMDKKTRSKTSAAAAPQKVSFNKADSKKSEGQNDSDSLFVRSHLRIVGTSHISKDSVSSIKKQMEEFSPDIVAIELDRKRFNSLQEYYSKKHKSKGLSHLTLSDIKRIGLMGYMFTVVGSWLQRKLGKKVGTEPGLDMKAAIDEAERKGLPLILIDQDMDEILRNFSKTLSFREKMRLLYDLTVGSLIKKEIVEFDLAKIPEPELVGQMISKLKDRYPNVYKALVFDRNIFMAKNITKLMKNNAGYKVLAVVGAGHEEEMMAFVLHSKNEIYSAYSKKEHAAPNFSYSFSNCTFNKNA